MGADWGVIATNHPLSGLATLVVCGIICLVMAVVSLGAGRMQRDQTAGYEDVNPLNTDYRSNMKGALYQNARTKTMSYLAIGSAGLGVVLLLAAAIVALTK
jgi:hypothetical protein